MGDSTIRIPVSQEDASSNHQRKKVKAIRPGFGLHDWTRLLSCTSDLAQRKGSPLRTITLEELSRHHQMYDGWMALYGKVYNIAPYLMYHPGGADILKQCLGRDATTLFEKYHRWVSIERLIGPLLIGYVGEETNKTSTSNSSNMVEGVYDMGSSLSFLEYHDRSVSQVETLPRPSSNYKADSLLSKVDDTNSLSDDDKNPWEKNL